MKTKRRAAQLDDAALARIGYVSQESRMMEWLTVAETIDFARARRVASHRLPLRIGGAGRELTYTPPSAHLNWLAPLLAPFIWLGVALRPRPVSNLPAAMMTMAFLVGYNTIVIFPNAGATYTLIGLAAVAGVVAFVMRRRWWQRADIAV
jgi:hypothetical protein